MRTRISVCLDGADLSDIDQSVVIQSIDEQVPQQKLTSAPRHTLDGQHYITKETSQRDVVVKFVIATGRDYALRAAVIERVCAWAAPGGWLTVPYRPDERLRVQCAQLPALGDVAKWGEAVSVTFRAFDVPWWQQRHPDRASIASTTQGSGTLIVTGNRGGPLRAVGTVGDTAVTTCAIGNGTEIISWTNGSQTAFSLAPGEKILLDYTDDGLQTMRALSTGGVERSVLASRTAQSADDIWMQPGANRVAVSSSAPMSWEVYCYGRWSS
jgi:hypothetical protein